MAIQVTVMSIDFDSFEEPITKVFSKNEITLGRTPNNDLVLDRPEVSSEHARLSIRANGNPNEPHLYVTDLGSSNGTMLERDGLTPEVAVPILPNQRLIIGSYLIKPSIVAGEVEQQEETPVENISEPTEQLLENAFDDTSAETMRTHQAMPVPTEEIATPVHTFEAAPPPVVEEPVTLKSEDTESTRISAPRVSSEVTPELVKVALEGSEILNINFEANQLFTLSGRITYKAEPVSGVRVDGGSFGVSDTSSDGKFAFNDILEGSDYRLTLSKEGYLFEPAVLSGMIDGDVGLHVSAIKLFQLSGRVLHKGAPLAGVHVDAGAIGSTVTGADGSYVFRDIREGTAFHLKVEHAGYIFDCASPDGTLEGDTSVNVTARQLLKIGGKVVHKGRPLAGVEIECVNLGKATTDADGMYYFENVPEGVEYVIRALKPGFKLNHVRS